MVFPFSANRRRFACFLACCAAPAAGWLLRAQSAPPEDAAAAAVVQQADIGTYLHGRAVFEQQCSPCHGRRGRGDGEWAADLPDKPRNFRTGLFKFRSTPAGFLPTPADLERTLRTGVSGTMMPAFKAMSDRDLQAVLAYVRGFSPRWKEPGNYRPSVPLPELPAWWLDADERARRARAVEPLFQAACAVCHGSVGRGDGPAAATLTDAWGHVVKPADFGKPQRKSGPRPQDVYRTIAMGLDGTPMAGYRDVLGEETLWSLVAHLTRLSEAAAGE